MHRWHDEWSGLDGASLSDPALYRWIEQQDNGWRELPEDHDFQPVLQHPSVKRFPLISKRLRTLFRKTGSRARRYVFQPA
jgi:hypothetical protein